MNPLRSLLRQPLRVPCTKYCRSLQNPSELYILNILSVRTFRTGAGPHFRTGAGPHFAMFDKGIVKATFAGAVAAAASGRVRTFPQGRRGLNASGFLLAGLAGPECVRAFSCGMREILHRVRIMRPRK